MKNIINKNLLLREAVIQDVESIATVHAQCWQETYQGLLSNKILEHFSRERLIVQWTDLLTVKGDQSTCFVAEISNKLVGFIDVGPQRTSDVLELESYGEYYALYVLAQAQRLGIGSALFERGTQFLKRYFYHQSLWVLKSNQKARLFYEKCQGSVAQSSFFQMGDESVEKLLYVWDGAN